MVRPPRPGDEAVLGPLHNRVWRVAYADLMPANYLRSRSDAEATRRWAHLISGSDADGHDTDGHALLIGEVNRRIVGFLMVGPGREPGLSSYIELMSLYVDPDFHGTGVAQELVAHGLPVGRSYLWVLDGNLRAQAFYRKLGYHLDGAAKTHEPSGCVEVRMVRPSGTDGVRA